MTAPRPGPRPNLMLPVCEKWKAEWNQYLAKSRLYWEEIAELVAAQIPCTGIEFIASGYVLNVVYEDRSYAWLGGMENQIDDGPWASGDCFWAGGYRYDPDSHGERFSDRVEVEVGDPDDITSVVEALVQVARDLGVLPFTQHC